MNKKVTRVLTIASAMAMPVMGVTPVFAQAEKPTTGAVKVMNVKDSTAKVFAYRVVEPTFRASDNALTGYTPVNGLSFKSYEKPTATEVRNAAQAVIDNEASFTEKVELARQGDVFTGNLKPGMYVVIVKDANTTVYNPAILSVNYANAEGDIEQAEDLNMEVPFIENAYLKSSKPTIDKSIAKGEGIKGDVVKAGDTVNFKVKTTLPSYNMDGEEGVYKNPVFKIMDKLDGNFDQLGEIVVKSGDNVLEATNYTLQKNEDGKGFTLTFTKDFLKKNGGANITLEYGAKLTKEGASEGLDFKANKNSAKIEYSNDPTDDNKTSNPDDPENTDTTYNYTFSLEGAFKKVDGSDKALSGAQFGVFSDENATKQVGSSITSDKDGMLRFDGLEVGTYYIKETKAPKGYSVNDTIYKVDIEATLNESTGVLESYKVTVTDQKSGTPVVSEFTNNATIANDGTVTNSVKGQYQVTNIKNTQIGKMPSTGGAGVIAFTGVGVILFLGSAAAFKKSKKEAK